MRRRRRTRSKLQEKKNKEKEAKELALQKKKDDEKSTMLYYVQGVVFKLFKNVMGLDLSLFPRPKDLLYCDGVGSGYIDGIVYKCSAYALIYIMVKAATAILVPSVVATTNAVTNVSKSVSKSVGTTIDNIKENDRIIEIEKGIETFQKSLTDIKDELLRDCETKIEGWWETTITAVKTVILDKEGIDRCDILKKRRDAIVYKIGDAKNKLDYEMQKIKTEAEYQAKNWFLETWRTLITYVLNKLDSSGIPGKQYIKGRLIMQSINAALMVSSLFNKLVCKLAGWIEQKVNNLYTICTFKQKQALIKSMSSELRLFDNSLKF